MDLSKENWYNGAICAAVLAATAPSEEKAEECIQETEEALKNLSKIIKAQVIKEAKFFLKSDQRIFNTWYRKNIKTKN